MDEYQTYSPFSKTASNANDRSPADPLSSFYSMADDPQLLNCFVHLPIHENLVFNLDFQSIAEAQAQDAELTELRQSKPQQYVQHTFADDIQLYCYVKDADAALKIYLPNQMIQSTIQWYHYALSHPGSTRLKDTIRIHFHNPKLSNAIEDFTAKCDTCQRHKAVGRGHGHTAPKEAPLAPWREVAVDLIGPWTLNVLGVEIEFSALTIIDLVTNLVEIVRIKNKTCAHVTQQFENAWLARYPRPASVIFDQGGEFTGFDFQNHLIQHGIDPRPISSKNPQANAVCERMHQSIGNSLRVLKELQHPFNVADAEQLVDTAIAIAVFSHRSSYHGSIASTPGSLAFNRDMVLALPMQADFQLIQDRRQQLIDKELVKATRRRFAYDYQPGQEVLKLRYNPKKLETRADGPYRIERVHTNGTLTIRIDPHTIERISLRRVKPYRR
jgi:transposase InsO family protein